MRTGDSFLRSSDAQRRGVSKITHDHSHTRLLVILQRVYILGPRTNLTWRLSHGESKEEGKEKSFEKEVRPSAAAGLDNILARRTSKLQTMPAYAGIVVSSDE
jgi:hypothetical protein